MGFKHDEEVETLRIHDETGQIELTDIPCHEWSPPAKSGFCDFTATCVTEGCEDPDDLARYMRCIRRVARDYAACVERARTKACEKWEELNEAWEAAVQNILMQEEADVEACQGSPNVFQCIERAKKKKQQALCDLMQETEPKFAQAKADLHAALNKCCEIAKRGTAECCG